METSQSVNAYNASTVTSGDVPGVNSIAISTSAAVLSVTFLIFIFPLSFALIMESISEVVVVPKAICLMRIVFLSATSIFARARILLPLSARL